MPISYSSRYTPCAVTGRYQREEPGRLRVAAHNLGEPMAVRPRVGCCHNLGEGMVFPSYVTLVPTFLIPSGFLLSKNRSAFHYNNRDVVVTYS